MTNRRTALCYFASALVSAPVVARAQSGRAPISIDRFEGRGRGRRPAVLLLHGSDGVTRKERYLPAAQALADLGFTVLLPHYLEASGDRRASFGQIQSKLPIWAAVLGQVIEAVASDPKIDVRRLGIVGVSLGGSLALLLAARDRRIGAVVSYYGFLPSGLRAGGSAAPTLLLHGARDFLVPVANADQIEAVLRSGGAPVEKQIYADQGHGFSPSAAADAATRTSDFLRRTLGA